MRPSGKMTSMSPPRTALMIARSENGLSGSSAMVRAKLRNGWIHQFLDMATSMAKTGRFGRIDSASGGLRKLTRFGAIIAVGRGLGVVLRPVTFEREKRRNNSQGKNVRTAA